VTGVVREQQFIAGGIRKEGRRPGAQIGPATVDEPVNIERTDCRISQYAGQAPYVLGERSLRNSAASYFAAPIAGRAAVELVRGDERRGGALV
jgi:hypothetical protein